MTIVCVVGSANTDLLSRVPRLPIAGETLHGSKFTIGFGGKGANQAVMAAKIGAQVRFLGWVGGDVFGVDTRRNFESVGIDTRYLLEAQGLSTGVAVISVDETTGQNSIIIVNGANDRLSPADMQAAAEAIQTADVVVAQLEAQLEASIEAFRVAKAGANPPITILNPAPARELPMELLALTDILIPNEIEAEMIIGSPATTPEQAEITARKLIEYGPHTVIITMGDRGAFYVNGDGESAHVPTESAKVVDSTGAGDSFVGTFAYLIGAGYPTAKAVTIACAVASLSVQREGTQSSYPTRDEVAHLL